MQLTFALVDSLAVYTHIHTQLLMMKGDRVHKEL